VPEPSAEHLDNLPSQAADAPADSDDETEEETASANADEAAAAADAVEEYALGDPDNVERALADARWAIQRADAELRSRRAKLPRATLLADAAKVLPKWKPVATAPPLRDLEVRVHDAVGRYNLFFPCRWGAGDRLNQRPGQNPVKRRTGRMA